MKLPKFIRKLYTKPLSPYERDWLYFTMSGVPKGFEGILDSYPKMTVKEFHKLRDRDELYR